MSYQVIARKWRPQTFDEVTGQEPITRTLKNAIEHERLHHAYLFSGARGVGKTTTARLLAKALNCHRASKPTATPCHIMDETACASCREIAEGRSIDVMEIDAASNTGVDNVREAIINTVGVRPARDRYKVFIIDEVHMLSGAAFNALLKTLEEPPDRVVFIMATTEAHKLPDTILSRCQQFEFRTIATPRIAERLRLIANSEGITVSDDALNEIARAGEGSMRDAQSAFDQVISFNDREITVEDVETALGLAGFHLLRRVMDAIVNQQPNEALKVVGDLVMRGHDLRNFCRDLLAHLRDLLVTKVSGDVGDTLNSCQAPERSGELSRTANEFTESDLARFFHSLTETEKHLRESAHPRYQLEIGLVKLIEMRRLAPLNDLIERMSKLEEMLGVTGGHAAGGTTGAPPTTIPGSNKPPPRASSSSSSSRTVAPITDATVSPASGVGTINTTNANASSVAMDGDKEPAREQSKPVSSSFAAPSSEEKQVASSSASAPILKLVSPTPPPSSGELRAAPSGSRKHEDASGNVPQPAVGSTHGGTPESITKERLNQILEDRRRPFLAIALEGARHVRVEGNAVHIEYASDAKHLRDNLAKPESVKILQSICCELAGRDMTVRIVTKDERDAPESPSSRAKQDEAAAEQAALRKMAEEHPLVQQVLRVFRGEIIDVRRVDTNNGQ